MIKNILITGAFGALGKAVRDHIDKLGNYQIFTTSRKLLNEKLNFQCDVRDKNQLETVLASSKPDIIIHLAVTLSSDFNEAYEVNVRSTQYILDYVQSKALKTRVILIGSAAEYGIVQTNENPICEDHVLAPISVYGITKAWQTQLIKYYINQGVDIVCARIFNLFGPEISTQLFPGRLASQITEILSGVRDIIEVGDLSAIRDYISTADAAEILFTIITKGETGKIYNVGSGIPIRIREFALNQMNACGLDYSKLKEIFPIVDPKGIQVPMIFADMTNTNKLKQASAHTEDFIENNNMKVGDLI